MRCARCVILLLGCVPCCVNSIKAARVHRITSAAIVAQTMGKRHLARFSSRAASTIRGVANRLRKKSLHVNGAPSKAKVHLEANTQQFVVERKPHLGLKVIVGQAYTAKDLRSRCGGDVDSLRRLNAFFADPTMLRPVMQRCSNGSTSSAAPRTKSPSTCSAEVTARNISKRFALHWDCTRRSCRPLMAENLLRFQGQVSKPRMGAGDLSMPVLKGIVVSKTLSTGPIASWGKAGRKRAQLLDIAEHRMLATDLTRSGPEQWGAVGCRVSHQLVLRRTLQDAHIKWALVLEDDATLDMPGRDAQEVFAKGIRKIAKCTASVGIL